ncbi:hypothetical protein [Aminivibrio sp.]|jgi:hypothetical protein|uniref:hypothetical protein n=1 Tax=Aminivibrio sp. TaxID=1872489 RepID=UPI0016BC903E|nr:hypothetical protein [Synergistaceae bacterium]NCC62340.1 hypothetical protein [Verrucomicrobiae bacterium]MDD3389675.1 hypothetical protein [Synergistaceae bacterium]MDD4020674.1 hypothetical protein [Synergistaceae bacterium]MDD4611553.1 hypothetical protein [Synergistaceae bacterium]
MEKVLKTLRKWWEVFVLFHHGTFIDKRMAVVRKEAFDINDNLMLLLFGDFLGIPNPVSYYMLELLPYVADDLETWERRIQNRKFIIAEKAAQYDFD